MTISKLIMCPDHRKEGESECSMCLGSGFMRTETLLSNGQPFTVDVPSSLTKEEAQAEWDRSIDALCNSMEIKK